MGRAEEPVLCEVAPDPGARRGQGQATSGRRRGPEPACRAAGYHAPRNTAGGAGDPGDGERGRVRHPDPGGGIEYRDPGLGRRPVRVVSELLERPHRPGRQPLQFYLLQGTAGVECREILQSRSRCRARRRPPPSDPRRSARALRQGPRPYPQRPAVDLSVAPDLVVLDQRENHRFHRVPGRADPPAGNELAVGPRALLEKAGGGNQGRLAYSLAITAGKAALAM